MGIHSNLNVANSSLSGLSSLLGVTQSSAASSVQSGSSAEDAEWPSFAGDWATLSDAGNGLAQASTSAGVRDDKVSSVRASIAAGSYNVPAQTVAASAMAAMLGR